MNFMNRRMFQAGGEAGTNPYFYVDSQGETQYLDQTKLLPILRSTDITALEALIQNPDVTYSPAAQEIFRQVVGERKASYSSTDPSLFNFGEFLPDNLTGISALRDIGGFAGDFAAQVGEGAYNLGRSVASGFGERSFDDEPFAPQDIFPSERFPNVADTITGRPGNDEGFVPGFDKSGILRRGYTNPQLASILARGKSEIQDFTKDIEAIEQPVVETVETKDVLDQPTVIEELPTLGPVTDSETLGVMSPLESTQRRLAFEEAMIGRDEFGNLLPEGRLLQDPTIAKALEELTPIESLVDIDKTEADSLLETQDKFDGKFDIPKIELDKVDTTKTLDDFNIDPPPVVPRETTGIFGSDRFLDFIRNVGGELARTGQMGEGLATGAAKAGEERAARDLLEADEQREFNKAKKLLEIEASLEGKGFMDYKEANSIGEAEESLSTTLTNFQKSEKTLGDLDDVFKDLEDPNAYGATGWLQESMDKFAAAAGMSTGKWKDLSSRSRINATLEVLTQMSVREVLGESGKTISNLDRNIVAEIFGNLTIFTDPSVIKDKLTRTRNTVLRSMQGDKDIITKDLSYFARTGVTSPLATQRQDLIDRILGIDLTGLEAPGSYRGSSTSSEQIYDTTL